MSRLLVVAFTSAVLSACSCGNSAITCRDFTDCPTGQICSRGECRATSGLGGGVGSGGSSGGGTGAGTSGGGSTSGGGTGGGSTCTSTCSDDLQASIDCNGVRTACPAGQGCSPTGCIDACAAAAAAGSTIGCDFYTAAVPPQFQTTGSCYAVLVANTWNAPITLTVKHGAQTLDVGTFARIPRDNAGTLTYQALPMMNGGPVLPQGEMAILFLAQDNSGGGTVEFYTACPSTPALQQPFQSEVTGFFSSFHISTSAPVIAYDMYPYGGADSHVTSTSLLIPTSAWGTNYVGVTPTGALGPNLPYLQLFGQEDNTQVAIQAPVAIQAGSGVPAAAANAVGRYTLNKGQVLQLYQQAELSGAFVKSDKPIAVWGGHPCMQLPLGNAACDSGHQQFPAVPLLGNDYLAVRHKERNPGANENALWRFVGTVNGTTLTYDPPVGGPATINAGQTLTFQAPGPFRVTSQDSAHVFYASQMMTGGESNNDKGDPEFVNLVPPQQYLRSYLFLTDPTYASTDLVFVRPLASDNTYHDVTLDCAGVLTGWFGIGGTSNQYARVSWTRSASSGCKNGVHRATSTAPFGLTVWGVDDYTSYGYPAGMSVKPINTVVVGPEIN